MMPFGELLPALELEVSLGHFIFFTAVDMMPFGELLPALELEVSLGPD